MTDIKDIEQRAKDMIERCRRKKTQREHAKLADKIFREPERKAAQKVMKEREEAERLKQLEERWNPYLEKAMQYAGQKKKEYDGKILNVVRK